MDAAARIETYPLSSPLPADLAPGAESSRGPKAERLLAPWMNILSEQRAAEAELRDAILDFAGVRDTAMTRPGAQRSWRNLLLGQVSAYDYAKHLSQDLQILATPRYRARGSAGPFDSSALVVRASDAAQGVQDLRGRSCAFGLDDRNSALRLSTALASAADRRPFFAVVSRLPTALGAVEALVDGEVDAALIDSVALANLQRLRPTFSAHLRVLLWSSRSPGPPLVTARSTPPEVVERLRFALNAAAREPSLSAARNALLIGGFNQLRAPYYRAIIHLEQIAQALDYAELA